MLCAFSIGNVRGNVRQNPIQPIKGKEVIEMNDAQRKKLTEAAAHLIDAKELIGEIRENEQETYDSIPENLQQGEKGQKVEEAINALEEAADACETALGSIDQAIA